jgi:hypothetical protein
MRTGTFKTNEEASRNRSITVSSIWLACGVTTVRDVGSDTAKTLALRERSAKGEIPAPRLFVYPMFGARRNC